MQSADCHSSRQKVLSEIFEAIKKVETMFGESFFRRSDQLLNAELFQPSMDRFPKLGNRYIALKIFGLKPRLSLSADLSRCLLWNFQHHPLMPESVLLGEHHLIVNSFLLPRQIPIVRLRSPGSLSHIFCFVQLQYVFQYRYRL
jgi:hypothetical protein